MQDDRPKDLARRLAQAGARQKLARDAFRRETFTLPRAAARAKAREIFARYPKAAYMTVVESWRELPSGEIEFTMRRLPSAD
jgi:muconolactone delta-isomerase